MLLHDHKACSFIFKVTAFHNSIRSFFCCRKGDWPTPTWNLSIFNWNHRKKINSPPKKKLIPKIIPHPTKKDIWEVPRMADYLFLTAVKCKLRDRNRVNPVATFPVILKATHQLGDRLTGRVDVPDHPASWLWHWKFLVNQSGATSIHWFFFILTCGKVWFFQNPFIIYSIHILHI